MNNLYLGLNAEEISQDIVEEFEGVGLIRIEYLCRYINKFVTEEECREYIYNYLCKICEQFNGKEVWCRFTDLTTNEIDVLDGCDHYIVEKMHGIGMKGVRRHLYDIETFKLEAKVVAEVSNKYPNLGVIIPYIKDIEEYRKVKDILAEVGYKGKIGIMAEIPSIILKLEEFIKEGVDSITIGLNDLTMLMLGTYRGSEYHDNTHPIMLETVNNVMNICKKNNVIFSVAGYFNQKQMDIYKELDIPRLVINYSNLPYLDKKYEALPDLDLLKRIKAITKQKREVIEKQSK